MILSGITAKLKKNQEEIVNSSRIFLSRQKAHKYRKIVVRRNGKETVNEKVLQQIKEYSNSEFGSSSYWPWLALYTEIRGKFLPGWIPQDYYRFTLLKKYNKKGATSISAFKTFDHKFFPGFSLDPLFLIISGNYYSSEMKQLGRHEVKEILSACDCEIVVKEAFGRQGRNIRFIHSNQFFKLTMAESRNYIVQKGIKQHGSLHELHPESVNTIRVTSCLEPDGSVSIKSAFLRFGLNGSRMDNVCKGGGHIPIEKDGRLHNFYYDKLGLPTSQKHPDSGVFMNEVKIPNFDLILEKCANAHKIYPYVKFVGWDVALGLNCNPVLIEWNTRMPSIWLAEAIIGPLWEIVPK